MSVQRFEFVVNVEVEREEGKFARKDELREQIVEALGSADPGTLEGEEGGVYAVTGWDVEEVVPPPKPRKASSKR